jgi:hypothetical protein
VWNMSPDVAVQQSILDELMSVRSPLPPLFMHPPISRSSTSPHLPTAFIILPLVTCCLVTCAKGLRAAPCMHQSNVSMLIRRWLLKNQRTRCLFAAASCSVPQLLNCIALNSPHLFAPQKRRQARLMNHLLPAINQQIVIGAMFLAMSRCSPLAALVCPTAPIIGRYKSPGHSKPR